MPSVEDQAAAPMPLPADPKRQAVDAWRGYYFQLLHTIHAWLELPEGTALHLEGAEDFDVIGPEEATAVQVNSFVGGIELQTVRDVGMILYSIDDRDWHGRLAC